ncbi:MAG: TraR/DksA family transcriptional regulator [Desulfosudaceae bacterium]
MRDDLDLEYFKERLEQRLAEIIEGKKKFTPLELDQSRIGRLTRMDAMQQQAMDQAATRLAAMEEQRIRTALRRLAESEYGYCLTCDEEIAEARLRVDPSVLNCITCARSADKDTT